MFTGSTLADGAVRSAYQPIVDLRCGRTVAFEALARFDPSTGFQHPGQAFAAAADAGPEALAELDQACIAAAVDGAVAAGLPSSVALFVNVLPTTLQRSVPAALTAKVEAARQRLRVVVEVTEVDVLSRPAELLALSRWNRRMGFGLAIDDVGVNPDSLSLLPLLRPDVIKLDRSILSECPTRDTGRVLGAVLAAAESTGAMVLAEGVETARDVHVAKTLGATYGQGWHLGVPGPLPEHVTPGPLLPFLGSKQVPAPDAPFDLVTDRLLGRDAPYEYLLAISHDLEAKAERLDSPIVMSTFQEVERFTPATKVRYEALARRASLVGALGEGRPREPAAGVRWGQLHRHDPIRHDWNVVVLAPHFAAALIARDLTGSGPVRARRYDYAVTHDAATATLAAESLMDRLVPVG